MSNSIGCLTFTDISMKTDEDGKVELTLKLDNHNRYFVKSIINVIRKKGKKVQAIFKFKTNKRTLDQNALMWKLLTIYADALNAGRTGGTTPEQIYMDMLAKYGVAEFIMTVPEAEEMLTRTFRYVQRVDVRNYNGKEMIVFKCYYGSHTYDTKQMANMIDGIFDELAIIGVTVETSVQLLGHYNDWQQEKYKKEKD